MMTGRRRAAAGGLCSLLLAGVLLGAAGVAWALVPGAPTDVTATAGDASATLTWNPPTDDGGSPITGYTVTTNGPGAPLPISTTNTAVTVTGLTNGVPYTFTVRATNADGDGPDSAPSNEVTPTAPPAITPPDAPTGVTATAGDASATLTWNAPTDDGGSPITGYTVTTNGPGAPGPINTTATNVTVNGLTNDVAYTFTVTAANVAGDGPDSAPSNEVTPTAPPVITPPGAPRGVSATAGDASANVTWNPPLDDGGSTITGYTVTTHGPGAPAPISTTNTAVNVGGLTNGVAYTFTVMAANVAGSGPPATSNEVTPSAVITPPGAPRAVKATAGDGSASVTWNPPLDDGGSPITGYTVTTNGPGAPGPISTTNTDVTIGGLTNGVAYTFTVTAANVAGSGPPATSNEVTPTAPPVITVPGAPTNVTAVAGNGSATVAWDAPAGGGSPITGYTVTTSGPGAVPAPTSTTATAVTVGGLANGVAYAFTVTAANLAGTGPSATSAAVTPGTVPGAPAGVSARPGDGSVTLIWSAPAADGGLPVTSYTVTARLGGVAVASVPVAAPATEAVFGGLTNGVTYTFTVSAGNAVGTGPASAPPALASPSASPKASGYWMVSENGRVYAFGAAGLLGQPSAVLGLSEAVDVESTPTGGGYRVLAGDGRVFAYGDATHLGDADPGGLAPGEAVTSLSATPSGRGYWIFTSRGRVLAFGDARFHGDMSAVALNGPVLDSVATPSGDGYYMVASDGGIFAFGDAVFHGSMGGQRLNAPVQSLVPDGDGVGYWLVASDGGVFAFEASFRGSMGGTRLNQPITGMVRFGDGYLMVGADGGIFNFSDRPFFGSLGASPPPRPIVAVAAREG